MEFKLSECHVKQSENKTASGQETVMGVGCSSNQKLVGEGVEGLGINHNHNHKGRSSGQRLEHHAMVTTEEQIIG